MSITWTHGLGLAVLLTLTGAASAQGPKGPKQFPGGNRGGSDVERVRSEVKALETQIERLQKQVAELSRRAGPEGKAKSGPPGFQGKGKGPAQAKGPSTEKGKFGPPGFEARRAEMAEMFKKKLEGKGFAPQSKERPQAKGAPDFGRGPMAKGGAGPWSRGNFKGPPSSREAPGRGASANLEGRVDRLERAIEELRREVRNRNTPQRRR